RVPFGFLGRLPALWWLDVRGGTANNLELMRGATKLEYLAINQVRGMSDLTVLSELRNLRRIDLYGLPKVTGFPSLAGLSSLEHASLGQMRGLLSLNGLLQAPRLRELQLVRKINVSETDIAQIAAHPTIKQFGWFAEDVPLKVWMPVVEKIGLPPV